MFYVAFKSGLGSYHDHDGCDKIIAEIPSNNIPSKGDILEFGDKDNRENKEYLVMEVKRTFNHQNEKRKFGEWIYVYVINL
ncbi:hypothetical protein [Planomicrobium sp. CPCC 101079]|uniref:hypothetical protein n=1 Tax=Planomicrobium sp. CPCC 101079 TaxID=2599618 RepID=UPI0016477926|nr:hypothetical protein [Planomicrobium sp. CPCC 101079]